MGSSAADDSLMPNFGVKRRLYKGCQASRDSVGWPFGRIGHLLDVFGPSGRRPGRTSQAHAFDQRPCRASRRWRRARRPCLAGRLIPVRRTGFANLARLPSRKFGLVGLLKERKTAVQSPRLWRIVGE